MLKLILTAILTVCGLPLKKHQLNSLILRIESRFIRVRETIVNYLAEILSDFIFLIKIVAIFRPRKRVLFLRSLLIAAATITYLFLGPTTFVNANYPERVIQPQTETAIVSIKEAVTIEAVPVFKTPVHGYISTYYSRYHRGVDIPNPTGSPVKPFTDGEVIYADWADGGFGKMVVVKHNLGYISRYAHLSTIEVGVGQKVTTDTIIGKVGSTGNSTGSHLHFEVYQNERPVNPLTYVSPSQ